MFRKVDKRCIVQPVHGPFIQKNRQPAYFFPLPLKPATSRRTIASDMSFSYFAKRRFVEKKSVVSEPVQIKFRLNSGVSYDEIYKTKSHLPYFESNYF